MEGAVKLTRVALRGREFAEVVAVAARDDQKSRAGWHRRACPNGRASLL